jgi:hypothetical protein
MLQIAARAIADNIDLCSGHGGFAFANDAWLKVTALDSIYALARRFWGVDVEDMNRTLPLMRDCIKGVNWLTLLGRDLASRSDVRTNLEGLSSTADVTVEHWQRAIVMVAGSKPTVGDQERSDGSLDPYFAVAEALRPLFLRTHPDFLSERFATNGNTVGWLRRFLEPVGWR